MTKPFREFVHFKQTTSAQQPIEIAETIRTPRQPFGIEVWVRGWAIRYRLQLAFVVGLFIGLFVLGWWLWPVEWTNGGFEHLGLDKQTALVQAAADLNAFAPLSGRVAALMADWQGDALACRMAKETVDTAEQMRLISLAFRVNGFGCQ